MRFAVRAAAWSLGLFGFVRVAWIQAHVVLPVTAAQATVARALFGTPSTPVEVTLACSGADALALCCGAILAYPAGWRSRLAGAGGGVALILGLNTLRIATLGHAAASPAWFDALHLYAWPIVLTLAIAGYAFAWMALADRPRTSVGRAVTPSAEALAPRPTRRFVVLAVTFLLIFAATSPMYLESAGVMAIAGVIARAAAVVLGVAGVSAYATDNVLWTARGGFLVTQECISTPVIPLYLAAVCSWCTTWSRRIPAIAAAVPLFIGLGVARLLLVALPDVIGSPLFLVHAFYQLLLGAAIVFLMAFWRHGGRTAFARALGGIAAGVLLALALGPVYARAVAYAAAPIDDPQGAIALMPAFQIGLYVALWGAAFVAVGWPRFLTGLVVLGLTQTAGLLALHGLAAVAGYTAHVRDVRAWSIAGPVLIVAAAIHHAQPRR